MTEVATPTGLSRYGALAAELRQRIVDGHWLPGTALPSEQQLATERGVALGTLRQALAVLAEEGLVERRHGRGTFVRAALAGAPMLRFFRFGERDGEIPASRIVSRQVVAAPAAAAAGLGLPGGTKVLRLRRVRSVGGLPRLLEELWLPLPLFNALVDSEPASWGDLLYPYFAERCGVHVHRVVDQISFAQLNATDARALKLDIGHPCALVQRQAYDLAGRCVEWRITRGDAMAFRYTVSIT
jgi:GntR family transcriptional regulator